MSQSPLSNMSSPLNGTDFFDNKLEPWRDAVHSMHAGASRPSYALASMMWIDNTTNPWVLNVFTGSSDVPLGTINTSTLEFTPSNIPTQYGGTTGGTANALTLTPAKALTAYVAGTTAYDALIASTNTTSAPTINVSAQGAKTIKVFLGAGKVSAPIGALQAGMIARFVYDGTDMILTNPRWNNPATAVASASTLNLDTVTGDYVEVTGTTTVTAVTLSNGVERTVKLSGILTLTHGASLILPSGFNIKTDAGDTCVLRGEPSGVVRLVSYQRAITTPPVMTDWKPYTPTFTGLGTVTGVSIRSRRMGCNLELEGYFTSGTATGTTADISLGFNGVNGGITAKTAGASTEYLGDYILAIAYAGGGTVLAVNGGSGVGLAYKNSGADMSVKQSGTNAVGNTVRCLLRASIPITEWTV